MVGGSVGKVVVKGGKVVGMSVGGIRVGGKVVGMLVGGIRVGGKVVGMLVGGMRVGGKVVGMLVGGGGKVVGMFVRGIGGFVVPWSRGVRVVGPIGIVIIGLGLVGMVVTVIGMHCSGTSSRDRSGRQLSSCEGTPLHSAHARFL